MVNNEIISVIGIIIGLTFAIELIFYGIAFPVMVLSDLNKSNELSKAAKVTYGVLIVSTWTFGALAYGLFTTKKNSLKILSWIFLLIVLIQALIFIYITKNLSGQNFTFAP